MIIIVIALCVLLLAGVLENALHQRRLKRIPLRILVNGTRGKTTVARMTAAVLGEAGIRTYAKTTGSQARRILPDGREEAYRRDNRPASMMEQLPFVRLAAKDGAQAIVVECMAQRYENQILIANKLIRPNMVLMTNAYIDHVEEIGGTEEETVEVLAGSIAPDCTVIAHDERFGAYTGNLVIPHSAAGINVCSGSAFEMHPQNVQLVAALCEKLGIDDETLRRGLSKAKPDIGMIPSFTLGGCDVRNAFAANDPISFMQALDECARQGAYSLLYNHRRDRAYRMEAFAQALRACKHPPMEIGVIGEQKTWCSKYFSSMTGIPAAAVEEPLVWIRERERVLCAGNIKGEGQSLLEKLIKEAQADV